MHVVTYVCQMRTLFFHLYFNCTWQLGMRDRSLERGYSNVRFGDPIPYLLHFIMGKLI